jgi:ATP-dependent Clp protease ATP-binding subunit ClpA
MYFNNELIQIFQEATLDAKRLKHEYLTIEHTIKPILNSKTGKTLISDSKVITDIETDLNEYFKYMETSEDSLPIKTEDLELILNNMMLNVEAKGKTLMGVIDFIREIEKTNSHASKILLKNKLYIQKNIQKKDTNNTIDDVSTEMVEQALNGEFGRGIGIDDEVETLYQTLKRKSKSNCVLIGESGVGKTTIVEELANKIAEDDVPDFLKEAKIYALNMGALLSNTKYRGEFEGKIKNLLDELITNPKNILFIDEIHTIIGVGSSSDSSLDVANLLKPYLSNGKLKVIGATTNEEYSKIFKKDKAISRRFTPIKILEPSPEDTKKILLNSKDKFEKHHKVSYADEVIEKAVEYSSRYITNRFLPDKAIDIIDIAGSKVHLSNKKKVTINDIVDVIENITKIKIADIKEDKDEKKKIKTLEKRLNSNIFGQEETIKEITNLIAKQKIFKNDKPISVLMSGATGTGKTEIVKQISEYLNMNLIRLDMSNYGEKHNVSNLLGSSSGLVGYEEGSPFLKDVQNNPYSIILLDEIEKAHQDIYNTFLAILDEGKIDDTKGDIVDFSNTIIVMTTNLGFGKSKTVASKLGFGNMNKENSQEKENILENIKGFFRPEFINRLDLITTTNRLSEKIIIDIVKKELHNAEEELSELNITIKPSQSALKELALAGFNEEYGARFIKRVIDKEIKQEITTLYLNNKVDLNQTIKLGYQKGNYTFKV